MYYFFIGTEAEAIKVAPVINELTERGINFYIFFSGQHQLDKFPQLRNVTVQKISLVNPYRPATTRIGHFVWFIKTVFKGITVFRNERLQPKSIGMVHGDTISTVMGTVLFRLFKIPVAHIEAGLRSHNIFDPFPEELNRIIVDRLSKYHFCPDDTSYGNLIKQGKRHVTNTMQNTLYDMIEPLMQRTLNTHPELRNRYAVVSLHRQQTVLDRRLFVTILDQLLQMASPQLQLVFIAHEITLQELNRDVHSTYLLRSKDVITIKRLPFDDFVGLIKKSEFIITDSGGNQEEVSYLGVPCFILRKVTERTEGLGKNVVLAGDSFEKGLTSFVQNYDKYRSDPLVLSFSPSKMIVDELESIYKDISDKGLPYSSNKEPKI